MIRILRVDERRPVVRDQYLTSKSSEGYVLHQWAIYLPWDVLKNGNKLLCIRTGGLIGLRTRQKNFRGPFG